MKKWRYPKFLCGFGTECKCFTEAGQIIKPVCLKTGIEEKLEIKDTYSITSLHGIIFQTW